METIGEVDDDVQGRTRLRETGVDEVAMGYLKGNEGSRYNLCKPVSVAQRYNTLLMK